MAVKYKKLPQLIKLLRVNIKTWQGRRTTQRVICMLQLMGMKIPYRFSLNISGPYSIGLARDLIELSGIKRCANG